MKVIIFGCGQGGQAVRSWLPASARLLAFSDNNPAAWSSDGEVPVIPPDRIPALAPDLVWIAIRNREAAESVQEQLRKLGYDGPVRLLTSLTDIVDLRLSVFRLLAGEIRRRSLPGAIAELGVHRGDSAAELNRLFPDRKLYLFDTFRGFPEQDLHEEFRRDPAFRWGGAFQDTAAGLVLSRLPHPEQAVICPGHFPDSLPESLPGFALVHLDPDLYEPIRQGLRIFWPLLSPGGAILVHDYRSRQFPGAGEAVREFCDGLGLTPLPLPDLHGSAVLIKQAERSFAHE